MFVHLLLNYFPQRCSSDLHLIPSSTPSPPTSALLAYTTLFRSAGFAARRHNPDWSARRSESVPARPDNYSADQSGLWRSEEHTSELQSRRELVCCLLLVKE